MARSIHPPDHLVVFAHGKESGPWGTKITRLAETARARGFEVLSPDYSHTPDPGTRVGQLLELAPQARAALVLVGSSMGGYVSAMACGALKPQALFLMAPALYFPGFDEEPPAPPAINAVVHGWRDDIVPAERAIRYAERHRAALHLLNAGHTLNDHLPELVLLFDDLLVKAMMFGAYRNARYGVTGTSGTIELEVGKYDPDADARLATECGVVDRWALVTACNPQGKRLSDAENQAQSNRLREQLDTDGNRYHPGFGADPRSQWPTEPSEFLCDPPVGYAEALALAFGQNAILRGRLGTAPELAWLR